MTKGSPSGISPALRYSIYLFTMLLLAFILFQRYHLVQQTAEFDAYKDYATEIVENLSRTVSTLQEQNQALQVMVATLSEENSDLMASYDALQDDVSRTIETITTYEEEIAESMDWFNENSNLATVDEVNDIVSMSIENCYRRELTDCEIKLGCFYLTNEEKLGITYKNDEITSGALDKLQSLTDFYANKGGDCEDYSLFYKAQYNHLFRECNKYGEIDVALEAWVPTDDDSRYWLDFGEKWFLPNATAVTFEGEHKYPNIVCGNIYDFNEDKVSGHCIVAFTKQKMTSENDIDLLHGAILIEPQNGRYMGRVNDEDGIYLLTRLSAPSLTREDSYIYQVVTDTDHLSYSETYNKWLSYSGLKRSLRDHKLELYTFLGE